MRTVVVTGGNTGIGFETAAALAGQGYNTIIACRDAEKGKTAVERINKRVPNGKIEARILDLADFSSIHQFAKGFISKKTPIDVLINNAGVMACPKMKTKDGLELQMGTNHFGHFLLTSLLYPLMKNHKRRGNLPKLCIWLTSGFSEARIVNLTSVMHRFSFGIDFDDINLEKSYSPWPAYGKSKLANVLFTNELARRIPKAENVTVNAVHPGVVATELQRHFFGENPNPFMKPIVALYNWSIKTPVQGAATSLHVATDPDLAGVTGKYFKDCKATSSHPRSHSLEDAKRLWDLSNEMTGAKWGF